jgi:hypothetical protein
MVCVDEPLPGRFMIETRLSRRRFVQAGVMGGCSTTSTSAGSWNRRWSCWPANSAARQRSIRPRSLLPLLFGVCRRGGHPRRRRLRPLRQTRGVPCRPAGLSRTLHRHAPGGDGYSIRHAPRPARFHAPRQPWRADSCDSSLKRIIWSPARPTVAMPTTARRCLRRE